MTFTRPLCEDVTGIAEVALLEDRGAGAQLTVLDLARQLVDLLARQRLEEVDSVEQCDDRLMPQARARASPCARGRS